MSGRSVLLALALLGTALAVPTPADVDRALRSGRPELALQLVQEARSEHLVSAKLDYLDAVARFRTGDLEGAAQSLTRARNIDPALAFANPGDVEAIDRAVNRRTGRGIFLGLCLVLLAVLAALALRARDRRRKRAAQWQRGLDAMRSRVRQREAQLDLELMEAQIRRNRPEILRLQEEQGRLWTQAAEAERGRLDPDRVAAEVASLPLKRPVPRRATAPRPEPAAPAPAQTASAPAPDDGLLTGVLLGQALASSPATVTSTPAPDPVPQRQESRDWSDSSLSSSNSSSWSDGSLSSSDSGSSSSDSSFSSSSSSDSW